MLAINKTYDVSEDMKLVVKSQETKTETASISNSGSTCTVNGLSYTKK